MMEAVISCAGTVAHHLWSVSWQVSILIVIIWLVDKLSWRASSLFKYWLWCIVLVRLCIPVNLAVPGSIGNKMGIIAPDIREVLPFQEISARFQFQTMLLNQTEELTTDHANSYRTERASTLTFFNFTGILWFAIFIILTLLIFARVLWISIRLKKCTPVKRPDLCSLVGRLKNEMGITRPVRLYYMDINEVDIPAVIGFFRPRIFLPRRIADEWQFDDLKPILLHELAHVKRCDLIINWLQVIIQIVYFFHPLVWYSNRQIRQIREEVCDDLAVIQLGTGKKRYTMSIVRVMEETLREPVLGFIGIGFTERKSSLGKRVKRIMRKNYKLNQKLTIISIVILMFVGITGIFFSFEQSQLKETMEEIHSLKLAVCYFEAQGVSLADAQKVSETLYTAISALIEHKRLNYTVLRGSQLDTLVKDLNTQKTSAISRNKANDRDQKLLVDRIVIGSVGFVGNTYSITARLVDVETGVILQYVDSQVKGSFDTVLASLVPKAAKDLFRKSTIGTQALENMVSEIRKNRLNTLAVMKLEPKGISDTEAEVFSDKLCSTIARTINKKDLQYLLIERHQIDKILSVLGEKSLSNASDNELKYGSLLHVDKIVVGSVGSIGKSYTVNLKVIDVEQSKSILSVERESKGTIDDVLLSVIPKAGKELFSD